MGCISYKSNKNEKTISDSESTSLKPLSEMKEMCYKKEHTPPQTFEEQLETKIKNIQNIFKQEHAKLNK